MYSILSSNTFSDELNLSSLSIFVVNNFYPEKSFTFRNVNIVWGIHFSPQDNDEIHIIGNH